MPLAVASLMANLKIESSMSQCPSSLLLAAGCFKSALSIRPLPRSVLLLAAPSSKVGEPLPHVGERGKRKGAISLQVLVATVEVRGCRSSGSDPDVLGSMVGGTGPIGAKARGEMQMFPRLLSFVSSLVCLYVCSHLRIHHLLASKTIIVAQTK